MWGLGRWRGAVITHFMAMSRSLTVRAAKLTETHAGLIVA